MNLEHTSNPNSPHFCGDLTFECSCCHRWVNDSEQVEDVLNVNGDREDICRDCFEQHTTCAKCGSDNHHENIDGTHTCSDCGFRTIEEDFFVFFHVDF